MCEFLHFMAFLVVLLVLFLDSLELVMLAFVMSCESINNKSMDGMRVWQV
jgi:hypothetical protein